MFNINENFKNGVHTSVSGTRHNSTFLFQHCYNLKCGSLLKSDLVEVAYVLSQCLHKKHVHFTNKKYVFPHPTAVQTTAVWDTMSSCVHLGSCIITGNIDSTEKKCPQLHLFNSTELSRGWWVVKG